MGNTIRTRYITQNTQYKKYTSQAPLVGSIFSDLHQRTIPGTFFRPPPLVEVFHPEPFPLLLSITGNYYHTFGTRNLQISCWPVTVSDLEENNRFLLFTKGTKY